MRRKDKDEDRDKDTKKMAHNFRAMHRSCAAPVLQRKGTKGAAHNFRAMHRSCAPLVLRIRTKRRRGNRDLARPRVADGDDTARLVIVMGLVDAIPIIGVAIALYIMFAVVGA